jgi:RHS repeat-associated protein
VEERLLPYLTRKGTELRWHLLEFDGTAVVSARSDGTVVGRRRTGAYGQAFVDNGDPLEQAGFHGIREETELGLMAAGPRHLMRQDGMWLQPEPLLYLGIPSERVDEPRGFATYRYAQNNPTKFGDPSGLLFELLLIASYQDPFLAGAADEMSFGYTSAQRTYFQEVKGIPSNVSTSSNAYVNGQMAGMAATAVMTGGAATVLDVFEGLVVPRVAHAGGGGSRGGISGGVVGLALNALVERGLAGASKGAFHVTPEGVALPPGKDFNLVPTAQGQKGDFLQIHQKHEHGTLNAESGIGAHTHKPEVHTSPTGATSTKRVDSATTAGDINQADAALKDGTMRERTGRNDRGDIP